MPNTAIITGASAGIGTEFARYHASLGGDLVITARRKATMVALKKELETAHTIKVHVIIADLSAPSGGKTLNVGSTAGMMPALNWVIPFLPRRMVLRMMRKMQSK